MYKFNVSAEEVWAKMHIKKIPIFIIVEQKANGVIYPLVAFAMFVGEGEFAFSFVGKPGLKLTRGFSLIFARISRIISSGNRGWLIDETRRRRLGRRVSWFRVKSIGSRIFPTESGRFDLHRHRLSYPHHPHRFFSLTLLWINYRNLIS